MTEPFKIYDDFFDLRPDDSTGIIRFYENNILLLDNKSVFKDKDEFSNYVLILSQYTISLENLGKYTKAINYAEKTLKLIDLKASDYDINLNQFTLYWSVLTTKGRAYYHLKDYSKSIIVFNSTLRR